MNDISKDVAAIKEALGRIMDTFTPNPSADAFLSNTNALIQLEETFNNKALLDAGVTKSAELARAGVLVGSNSHLDFFIKKFRLSRAEAFKRARLAEELFGNPEPEPKPVREPDPVGETGEERRAREAAEEKARRKREKAEKDRKDAYDSARGTATSAEKLAIINQELNNLNSDTIPARAELLTQATKQAVWRNPEDLRTWLRNQVIRANKSTPDPFAALRKRGLKIGDQDSDGGVQIFGYLPADSAAMLDAALASLSKKGDLVEVPVDEDTRTLGQRRADGLNYILTLFNSSVLSKGRKGIGSIVVSMTAEDVENIEENGAGHRYPTNTGIKLTPYEILNLGAAKYDFGVVLDGESGRPLHLGRTQRSASLEQRIALQAAELVCTGEGCDKPMIRCEIHHLDPWIKGGLTDIENLTGQCFHHHPENDDTRTGVNNKGYMDIDPYTGRVGHCPADASGMVFNDSAAQEESGGAKAREKHRQTQGRTVPADKGDSSGAPPRTDEDDPPDGALFKIPA